MRKKARKPDNVILRNAFGTVRPYTRHTSACPHKRKRDYPNCRCAKWLYTNKRGEKPERYTLNTYSWVETQRIAADTLRGFDPEIAAARVMQEKKRRSLMTIADGCDLWLKRTERQFGPGGSLPQYRSVMKQVQRWADSEGIIYIQDVETLALENWYSGHDWLRLSEATRQQRWGVLRSVFKFWVECGVIEINPIAPIKAVRLNGDHLQGPYIEEQIAAIFAAISKTQPVSIDVREKAVYVQRLEAFISFLLHTGCDVVDACLLHQNQLEDMQIAGRFVTVFRYRRQKTGGLAVIPLPGNIVRMIREVPMCPRNPERMPFRSKDSDEESDVHLWSRRIKRVLMQAGVEYVDLPTRDSRGQIRRKAANAKQFRHTFAVNQLRAGQRPEEIARMLGHVDPTMVRKHYSPWVKELDQAHILAVVQARDVKLSGFPS